jgi:hypothetical protein
MTPQWLYFLGTTRHKDPAMNTHHCVTLKHQTGPVPVTLYIVQFVDTTAFFLRFVVICVKLSYKHLITLPHQALEDIRQLSKEGRQMMFHC